MIASIIVGIKFKISNGYFFVTRRIYTQAFSCLDT
nr:MAG TPA: hypothetical protein [Caudoviricetes sp.]DAY96151.1 MAG TPA: hypothetical protein [Caudoviricetes sp.]